MSDLLDPDPEFGRLAVDDVRAMVSRPGESVLRRGRAAMEMGRRARDPSLLPEVAALVRDPAHRRLVAVGSTSLSQLGTAGLVSAGTREALALAAELAGEWDLGEQSDFAWLMRNSGMPWPPGA